MKYITVLIPEGDISLTNVEGMHHIFQETNKALVRAGAQPAFCFQLAGKKRENLVKENFFGIYPRYLIGDDFKTDLLIIPALHTNIFRNLDLNKDLIPWVVEQ